MRNILVPVLLLSMIPACRKPYVSGTLLDKITPESPMVIEHTNSGCFNMNAETITISRSGNQFLWQVENHATYGGPASGHGVCNSDFPRVYAKFEKNGRNLKKDGGCTSTQTWEIKVNGETLSFMDRTCMFEDFVPLCKTFE